MPVRDGNLTLGIALQNECPLFEKLPQELRDQIYEYVFTTTNDSSIHRNLATTERPFSNLLLTCQRMFNETSQIYEIARTQFWTENIFIIDKPTCEPSAKQIVENLHDREISLIQQIVIAVARRPFDRFGGEWFLTCRGDCMRGWLINRSSREDDGIYSTVGKRRGLNQMLELLE